MRRSVRAALALAAVSGLLGTTVLGAMTGLHVLFEHARPHGTAEHAHHHGASPEDHADSHETEPAATGHSHADTGHLRRQDTPEHRHPLTLAAELQPGTSRPSAGLFAGAPAYSPDSSADPLEGLYLGATTRAGPAATAAPSSRHSAVLQI